MARPTLSIARKASRGFTLIELALVLGIGALITAGVYASFASRNQDIKVRTSVQDMDLLVQAADRAYASRYEYRIGTTDANLAAIRTAARELPASFFDEGGGTFTNPWGGLWSVGVASTDASTGNLLTISVQDIPSYACVRMASTAAPRFYDTTINGNLVALTPARTPTSQGRSDVDIAQVTALCAASEENDMVFRRLKPADYMSLRQQPMLETLTPGLETCTDPGCFQPTYDRTEAALNAREAAQLAL